MRNLILLFTSLFVISACATNPIKDSWVDPSQPDPVRFEKTLVVVIMTTPADRRVAEDEWVRQLPMINGERSYTIISDAMLDDLDQAKSAVEGAVYKHALIMRFVGSKQELVNRPASATTVWGPGFWSYYGSAVTFHGGGPETRERVTFELSLYNLNDDRLIWTGNGQLINPREVAGSVSKLAAGLATRWEEQGLIAAQ